WRRGPREVPNTGLAGYTGANAPGGGVGTSAWGAGNVADIRGYNDDATDDKGACVINCSNYFAFYSFHLGGAHATMADGSARLLSEGIDVRVFTALMTRDGEEIISDADL
ncbi:MAG: DUF1559 domain-containing protein, partial [Planctomycetia bacterium]